MEVVVATCKPKIKQTIPTNNYHLMVCMWQCVIHAIVHRPCAMHKFITSCHIIMQQDRNLAQH